MNYPVEIISLKADTRDQIHAILSSIDSSIKYSYNFNCGWNDDALYRHVDLSVAIDDVIRTYCGEGLERNLLVIDTYNIKSGLREFLDDLNGELIRIEDQRAASFWIQLSRVLADTQEDEDEIDLLFDSLKTLKLIPKKDVNYYEKHRGKRDCYPRLENRAKKCIAELLANK